MTLHVKEIYKSYQKGKLLANAGLDCRFEKGQITALIGHNGAGKTTLLNQMIGISQPDSGEITYHGKSLTQSSKRARRYVSMMPQLHAPLKGVSIKQAVTSIAKIRGLSGSKLTHQVDEVLTALDIKRWENHKGEKLSGGLKRLTSFAMAVVGAPAIILLDEPTNDVDPLRRKKLWLYLKELAKKGHIVIIVTHNILEVEHYADYYYLLDQGRVKASGSVKTLNIASSSRVTFQITSDKVMTDFPFSYTLNEGQVSARITEDRLSLLFDWLLPKLADKSIRHYHMSPLGLTDYYEEVAHED